MSTRHIAQVIAIAELLVAVPLYEIYRTPFRFLGAASYWTTVAVLTNLASLAFIALPFIALFGVSTNRSVGYWALALFPLIALVFGVTAVPFVKHLYGTDVVVNSYSIIAVNLSVFVATVWLYLASGLRSPRPRQ